MDKFRKWLAKSTGGWLCIHDWKCISDAMVCTEYTVRFKCIHCGNEEGMHGH